MADPRVQPAFQMTQYGPKARSANLSPLMKAKSRAHQGQVVNACPHGCEDAQLDEHGYCRHLVGFSNDGKHYEPLVRRKGGRRVVQVPRDRVQVGVDPEDGAPVFEEGPPQLEAVRKSDQLVLITVSYRVYRDVDADKKKSA